MIQLCSAADTELAGFVNFQGTPVQALWTAIFYGKHAIWSGPRQYWRLTGIRFTEKEEE